MQRAIIVVVGLWIILASCTERMICPAYQSAYIYDKDELRKKFSYFIDDSTPKVYTASKNKYLIAEPVSYARKVRNLQTVVMKPVNVVVPDSISGKATDSVSMADMMRATQSVRDSTFIADIPKADSAAAPPLDSVYVITKDKEVRLLVYDGVDSLDYDSVQQKYVRQKAKYYVRDVRFNLEQEHYLWYLRDELVLPDVKLAKAQQKGEGDSESGPKRKKKRGLFKKKTKEQVDTTTTVAPPTEEFDFVDEADTLSQAEIPQPGQDVKKEKKGLFNRKKKVKPPKKSKEKNPEETPAEKKDDDDGF
jgi:hypothetical protein